MSETETYARHAHLRADVPKRRLGYKIFLVAVILVFIISILDIIFWDEILFWPVVIAYVFLIIYAVILLFSRSIEQRRERALSLREAVLHCRHCDHAFMLASDHADDPHGATLSCPVCGVASKLPAPHSEPDAIHLPDEAPLKSGYQCSNCEEHFVITTFGKRPRGVDFGRCPHCDESGTIRRADLPGAETTRITDWTGRPRAA